MPGPSLTTDAVILGVQPPSDSFQGLTAFSPAHGLLRIFRRTTGKTSAAGAIPDLFDELTLTLEGAPQGDAWFLKETRLLARHAGIARRYKALVRASALATIIARNPGPEDSRADIHALLRTAFGAFATSAHPDVVYLKSLYRLARDEGYPLSQQWLPSLPPALRATASALLRTPLGALTDVQANDTTALVGRLEAFLRDYTDIQLS